MSWALASPPTLCRLENRIERRTLVRIAGVFVDQFIASHAEPPEHLTLDFDATDDPMHGRQEERTLFMVTTTITATCPCTSFAVTSC